MIRIAGYTELPRWFPSLAAGADWRSSLTPAKEIAGAFAYVNRQVLDMAKDFPADKYDYKLRPEMRTLRRGDRAHRLRQRVCR